jgi:hypothetical protein
VRRAGYDASIRGMISGYPQSALECGCFSAIIVSMERLGFFYRWYRQIGTAFLVLIGFFLVFFSVLRSKDSHSFTGSSDSNLLMGVAHADVPSSSGSSSDSGDDGGGDCGDSGGK